MEPAPSVSRPQATCERCGTFVDALAPLGGKKVCRTCEGRAVAEGSFWSATYLIAIGALLNVTPALALLALNHRRLGDEKQARSWAIGAAVAGVIISAIVAFDLPIPSGALIGGNLAASISIGRAWRPTWDRLNVLGAKKANRWLPPLVTVLSLVAVALVSGLVRGEP